MAKPGIQTESKEFRPPVVAVVGHVDHGKTTLLDTIRKTNVAAREHGGITQHIGAYQITTTAKSAQGEGRKITFIDTPGHEAFTAMRSRGARAADIAILVVAADDSVKPQTIESIRIIKDAAVPVIVAINKIDLPAANPDKVKKDLAREGIQLEGFGGEVPYVALSAKSGKGITDLLEMILLLYDLKPVVSVKTGRAEAVIVETRLDKGKGIVATAIIMAGTLSYPVDLFEGAKPVGRVRALFDEFGQKVTTAVPGQPVEILGFTGHPSVGDIISSEPLVKAAAGKEVKKPEAGGLPDFLKPLDEVSRKLPVLVKADTAGSLEAVITAIPEGIEVVYAGIGSISEADILMAKSTAAFVIGFSVTTTGAVRKLAQTEKVALRTYDLIYELLEELREVAAGAKELLEGETEIGSAEIIAEFPFSKTRIAGIKITGGRIARGDRVKLMRDNQEISRAKVKSVRQGKNEVSKVSSGGECGILFEKPVDFQIGDSIIAVSQI